MWTLYISLSLSWLLTNNSNPDAYTWCLYTFSIHNVLQSPRPNTDMLWEKCRSRSHSTKIFPAPFPERSGTKVSYRVSVSTFQLPIIEQIALNQIYLHGLFFVIWVQSDYRIMTELCLKWWQTTWILLVICSPLAGIMGQHYVAILLACCSCMRRLADYSGHKGKDEDVCVVVRNLIIKSINVWENGLPIVTEL